MTVGDTYLQARRTLKKNQISGAELEAKEIIAFAAGISKDEIITRGTMFLSEGTLCRINALIERRIAGEPLAYILGEWDFYSLTFKVTKDVLIPRPDTETLVTAAAEILQRMSGEARVLDLCAGSGCVGIAAALTASGAHVVLADISEAALAVARENVKQYSLTDRVYTILLDALEKPADKIGDFDIIVCNPPYIPTGEIATLDISVKDYEPITALDGGYDGLDFYRSVTKNFAPRLKSGGRLLFECGLGQFEDVKEIMRQEGYTNIKIYRDLSGIERVVSGKISKNRTNVAFSERMV